MKKRKRLNIGQSDFKDIIENDNYFIDKSLLIKEIIEVEKNVLLLPRPRRFGKTLNLSMLKYYFDISEPENEKLFANLKIWQTENKIKKHCGKYPVIYLSFKDAKANTWEVVLEHLKIEIAKLYNEYYYIFESNVLHENEKIKFNKILNETAKQTDFETSIKQLSEYLHRYHKQKVVILIDEYDTPIQSGYGKFYDDVVPFMRNLLSGAFKDNSYLYKGVITGILRVSKESIFTGLNNLSVFSIFKNGFSDRFGFTETEVKQILLDFEIKTPFSQIQKWYDGYQFGNTCGIYNPWSILNYVTEYDEGFATYWVNTSSDELIKTQLKDKNANEIRKDLFRLINNEIIVKEIEENFVFPDLNTDKELLWTLLTYSGYLTQAGKVKDDKYKLRIPNSEIKTVFKKIVIKWLSVDIKIRRSLLENTAEYLINNEIEKFEMGFKEIMGDTFSYFDTANQPEKIYHSYVLGLLAILTDDYILRSNRESGEGRYDILLRPFDNTKYGIVIEIKTINADDIDVNNRTSLINKTISEAKNQIEKNKYYKELIDNKIEKIIKLPIVFIGKEPYIMKVEG